MSFDTLGLSEPVLQGVREAGFSEPTPIQAQAIPAILQGRDVLGASQTGTGKTAAFALPLMSRLGQHGALRCLILEPTRELAAQVLEHLTALGTHTGLRCTLLHGGVGYGKQREDLAAGMDIVIATPGRLWDHLQQGTFDLRRVEILVLDEVDRMLDMGFLPSVRKIVDRCPKERQTLFFSATMPPELGSMASWAVKDPVRVEIERGTVAASTITHAFYPVATEQRRDLLLAILEATEFHSVMIFTRTKAQADDLAYMVKREDKYQVAVMHADVGQKERTRALAGFRDGTFDVIIATDIAARGLDISNVTHVINYSVPENAEDYVHRIGRTGRAEKEGDAFTILTAEELPYAESVERFVGQKIERKKLPGFPYLYTTLLDDDSAKSRQALQKLLGIRGRSKRR